MKEELLNKLYENIKSFGWNDPLKGFMFSSQFTDIINSLSVYVEDNQRFVPKLKDIFNSFKYCPYDSLKVVFIVDNPYKSIKYNTGMALNTFQSSKSPQELLQFLKALKESGYNPSNDLTYLTEQGILLLNTSLTTDIERDTLRHNKLWKPFIVYLLDILCKNKDYIFVLIGDNAKEYEKYIKNNPIICLESIPIDYRVRWKYDNVFFKINEILASQNKEPINW